MTNAYCDLLDVKSSLAGDVPNMGSGHDLSLVKKILEVSRDMDRMIAKRRGEPPSTWSFLADQLYTEQIVYLSSTPPPSAGTFTLTVEGETTADIAYTADGPTVETAINTALADTVVSVSGPSGGPYVVTFAGAYVGPRDAITGVADLTPATGTVVVLPTVVGVESVHTERLFYPSLEYYGGLLLPIDDCVEIVSVTLYDGTGAAVQSLTEPADYRRWPLRDVPIQAIKLSQASGGAGLTEWPSTYGVVARWGYATEIPYDAREAARIEVVRAYLSGQAGEDDRIGMTPFGSVVTSKAFTSKFKELVDDYGGKLW